MPQGLQVWNASGDLVLTLTDNLTRVVATVSVAAGASGSVQLPEGRPFWFATNSLAPNTVGGTYSPAVSVNGSNLLSYSTGPLLPGATAIACTLVVGVY